MENKIIHLMHKGLTRMEKTWCRWGGQSTVQDAESVYGNWSSVDLRYLMQRLRMVPNAAPLCSTWYRLVYGNWCSVGVWYLLQRQCTLPDEEPQSRCTVPTWYRGGVLLAWRYCTLGTSPAEQVVGPGSVQQGGRCRHLSTSQTGSSAQGMKPEVARSLWVWCWCTILRVLWTISITRTRQRNTNTGNLYHCIPQPTAVCWLCCRFSIWRPNGLHGGGCREFSICWSNIYDIFPSRTTRAFFHPWHQKFTRQWGRKIFSITRVKIIHTGDQNKYFDTTDYIFHRWKWNNSTEI